MPNAKLPLMNNVQLAGRLTRAPEIISTQGGKRLAKFTVAQSRKVSDGEERLFLDCTAWDRACETAATLTKGAQVIVEGQLKQEEWTDKTTGAPRSKIGCNCHRIHALEWPENDSGGAQGNKGGSYAMERAEAHTRQPAVPQQASLPDGPGDDIPF